MRLIFAIDYENIYRFTVVINILIKFLEEKVTASIGGHCVPSESIDSVSGPTIHLTSDRGSNDKHSAIGTQQEDNGRSGETGDNVNNAGGRKGYHFTCSYMKCLSMINT